MTRVSVFLLLAVALLLTGCGTINFEQKLHRDGTTDVSISIQSDNEMFLDTMREAFEGEVEGATVTEIERGFRISKEGFDPLADREETAASGDGNVSALSGFGFEREFRFPYYYYTLRIDNTGVEEMEENPFTSGFKINYVVDPFGTITETNGAYVDDDRTKVRFDLLKNESYFVTFRDIFLASWAGGATGIIEREAEKHVLPEPDVPEEESSFFEVEQSWGVTEPEMMEVPWPEVNGMGNVPAPGEHPEPAAYQYHEIPPSGEHSEPWYYEAPPFPG